MNYKSNKIFTKCCASILAVSNIFSGVSATPKKAEDNQLSISTNEFLVSVLGASGSATLATFFFLRRYFTDTTEDIEEVESMALALEHTVPTKSFSNNYSGCGSSCSGEKLNQKGNTYIDKNFLIRECGVSSCSDLLDKKDIIVTVNGVKYKYVMSSIENPSGTNTPKGKLSDKLRDCLYGVYDKHNAKQLNGLNDSGWSYDLPFVIHLTAYSSNKTKVCRKHTVVKLKSDGNCQKIECLSHGGLSADIDISKLYPDNSSDKALIVIGYWQKQT